MSTDNIDYATTGMDIQSALVDRMSRYPDKNTRPDHILWGGLEVTTLQWLTVPKTGRITITLLDWKGDVEQAVDAKAEKGHLFLENGEKVELLRTWCDPRYEPVVSYPYTTKTGRLYVCNAFKRQWQNGRTVEDRWTGNAGFWVEKLSELDRIYHCSHGMTPRPDFTLLTFRATISEL